MEEFNNAMDSATVILLFLSMFLFFHFRIHIVIYHFVKIAINGQ